MTDNTKQNPNNDSTKITDGGVVIGGTDDATNVVNTPSDEVDQTTNEATTTQQDNATSTQQDPTGEIGETSDSPAEPEGETDENKEVVKDEKPAPKGPNHDVEFPTEIRINPEAQKQQNELFAFLKGEMTRIEGMTIDLEDEYKSVRKNLVDLKERVDALFLIEAEDKQGLLDGIQTHFVTISDRMDEKRKEAAAKQEENYRAFEEEFNAAIKSAEEDENFNNGRKTLIELQKKVKKQDFTQDRKTELLNKIQSSFDGVNERHDKYREELNAKSEVVFAEVKPKVEETVKKADEQESFTEARKMLVALQKELKEKDLRRKHSDELYGMIRESFDRLNKRQDEYFEKNNEIFKANYEEAKPKVQEAIDFATKPENFGQARKKLIDTQNMLKGLKMRRSDSNELFGAIRSVFSKLNESSAIKDSELDEEALQNYEKLKQKVGEAAMNVKYNSRLNDIRDGLVAVQEEVKLHKLTRKHRNELLGSIRSAFAEFDKKKEEFFGNRKSSKKQNDVKKAENQLSDLQVKEKELAEQIEIEEGKLEHLATGDEAELIKERLTDMKKQLEDIQKKIEEKKKEVN
ncbi:MAG: hypothetical protein Kapaf2KO_04870 [Candidatus Kapaibacteriales bacterium]